MLLSRTELERLTDQYNQWHISIYMPTHQAGDEIQQDPIRLENLLDDAEQQLIEGGMGPDDARSLLAPARDLIEDPVFWQHQSGGLAMFLSSAFFRHYRLPVDFEPLSVVSERFHIKPLLHLLSDNGQFYLLTLSQQGLELYRGTQYSIGEVPVEDVPESLSQVLRWEDPEKRLQLHTGSEAVTNSAEAVFHGHGTASEDDPKVHIRRYFQRVDAEVSDLLAGEHAPLVLAGVDYLQPLYQEANTYPHLVEEGVEGHPEQLGTEELHRQAWEIVQSVFAAGREEAANGYRQLAGSDSELASSDLEALAPAACYERVRTLFVAVGEQCWGTFEPDTGEVHVHEEAEPGDQDLLDLAAAHTLLNGGIVYAVEPEAVPDESPIAGILRY